MAARSGARDGGFVSVKVSGQRADLIVLDDPYATEHVRIAILGSFTGRFDARPTHIATSLPRVIKAICTMLYETRDEHRQTRADPDELAAVLGAKVHRAHRDERTRGPLVRGPGTSDQWSHTGDALYVLHQDVGQAVLNALVACGAVRIGLHKNLRTNAVEPHVWIDPQGGRRVGRGEATTASGPTAN